MSEETPTIDAIKKNLSASELFVELNDEQLTRLAGIGELRAFARGATIFAQGDEGQHMFVVCQGAVRVSPGPFTTEQEIDALADAVRALAA